MSFNRMAGVAGLMSVVFFVVGFALFGAQPNPDATAAEIAAYITDTGTYEYANAVTALATLFMLVFFVGFARPFKAADREHGEGFGTVIVASSVVAVTLMGAGASMFGILAHRLDGLGESGLWVLWDGGNVLFAFAILSFFIGGGAAAVSIMRHGVMAKWFGMLSAIVALAALGGLVPFFATGSAVVVGVLVGYLGIMVWLLVGSILLVRKGETSM